MRGLQYRKGKFAAVLGAGQYWYSPFFTLIENLDVRPRFVSITGQEVLSADGLTLKARLAALEKARGETAALRNLANAARMLEGNPNLMQLRLVQALGEASGSTLVLGLPAQTVPVPVSGDRTTKGIGGEGTAEGRQDTAH